MPQPGAQSDAGIGGARPDQCLANLRSATIDILRRYRQCFPDEAGRHRAFERQLASGEDLSVRSNMTGHATSSALVLNQDASKVLLIHHKTFYLWLPPGGHYEAPGSLWESAQREVQEETGLSVMSPHPWMLASGLPLDIDTHPIPANPGKGEAAHYHHDLRFLTVASDRASLSAQIEEVHAAHWLPVESLAQSPSGDVRALYAKLVRLGLI